MAIEALLSHFAKRKRAGDSWSRDDRGPGPAAMTTSAADDDDNDDNEMENTEAMEEEEWWAVDEDWAEQGGPPTKRCRRGGGSGGDRPPDSELMQGALCLSIAKMNAYRAHREPCLRRSVLVANMTHRLKKDMRAKRRRPRGAATATTPAQLLDARATTPPVDLATREPLVPNTPLRAASAEVDAAAAVRSPAPWSSGEESRRGALAAAAAAAPAEVAAPVAWPTEELFWKPSCGWDEGSELTTVSLTDSLLQAAGLSGPDPAHLAMDLSHTLDDIFAKIDTALYDFDLFSPGVLASCAAGSASDGGGGDGCGGIAPVLAAGYGGGESDGSGDSWLRCFPVACGSEASGTPASQWKAELSDLEHIMEVLVGS
ncbi:uncharacterized protein LOC116947781 isoform X2 [Petromyzon marinus]|uniref:uncharacterized protein LOC116947781 isoform X2 n=1 Tax=Petromyzon marinus TaxID=7757 RepID=UPI003F70E6E1